MTTSTDLHGHGDHGHHKLSLLQPFTWLSRGWDDMFHTPAASFSYGFIVAFMGLLLLMLSRHPYFLATAISGFLLVGPILTTGLCELSRRREAGEPANFDSSLSALTRNRVGLERFAVTLLAIGVAWFLLSTLMLQQLLGRVAPEYGMSVWSMWSEIREMITPDQMLAYLLVAGSLAAIVFALSVVAVPMLIDRQVSASEAIQESLRQTLTHLPTMIVWAGLIVGLVAVGFMSLMLGLVLVFPWLGHATWHAYRDLLQD